jgi:hypothetical protein
MFASSAMLAFCGLALAAEYASARAPVAESAVPADGEAVKGPIVNGGEAGAGEGVEAPFAEGTGEEEEAEEAGGPTGTSASTRLGEAPPGEVRAGAPGEAPVRVSALRLVRASASALTHREVRASRVRFEFTLSAASEVHVTLARASDRAGEVRWRALPDSRTLTAARGSNRARLHAANVLSAGEYRLTVRADDGAARSVLIRVR